MLEEHCGNIPVVLFANKIDIVDEERLNTTKIQKLANERNFLKYFITSAKTGHGVIEAFNAIIEHLYFKFKTF